MSKPSKQALVRKGRPTPKGRFFHQTYQREDGSVDGEKLLRLVEHTPGAVFLMMAGLVIDESKSALDTYLQMDRLVNGLTNLFLQSAAGDDTAASQLKAIEKLIKPAKYELPFSKIREIIDRYELTGLSLPTWPLFDMRLRRLKKPRPYVLSADNFKLRHYPPKPTTRGKPPAVLSSNAVFTESKTLNVAAGCVRKRT